MVSGVTGAAGFLGGHLVEALLERGQIVRAYARSADQILARTGDIQVVECDLMEPSSLAASLAGVEVLYHTAGMISRARTDRDRMYRVNVDGTRNVLQAALEAGVERVVHTSSSSAVGHSIDGRPTNELTTWIDSGAAYGRSKRAAEQVAFEYCRQGLPVVIVNPTFMLGPGGKDLSTTRVVGRVVNGSQPAYVTGGICPVDVADAALGHILAAERGRPGERYLLGGTNVTWEEFFALLAGILGTAPLRKMPIIAGLVGAALIERVAPLRGKTPDQSVDEVRMARQFWFHDSSRAEQELGFHARSLKETLERTVDWLHESGMVAPRESVRVVDLDEGPTRALDDATGSYVRAADGTRLHYLQWRPSDEPRATLLFLHGIASHAGWFRETGEFLAGEGISVYAADRRGSGASEGDRGHLDAYELARSDLREMIAFIRDREPRAPVFLAASSWAAKLAVVDAADRDDLAGLLLMGPGLTPRVGLASAQRIAVGIARLAERGTRMSIPLTAEMYTADASYQEAIRLDRRRLLTATTSFFWETARLDRRRSEAARQLRLPLLLLMGGEDAMMDVDATRRWFSTVASRDKSFRLYPDAGHTLDFEPDPRQYRDDVLQWIRTRAIDVTERRAAPVTVDGPTPQSKAR